MILNKDRQKFIKGVGILILLQGLAWFSMSVAGIVVKNAKPDGMKGDITKYTSYSQYLSRIIYDDFFEGKTDKVIRPQDFEAFLWIYAILSAVWVAVSLDQNLAVRYKKTRQSHIALVLGIAILVTSVIDLVFVSLLARDYDTCEFDISVIPTTVPTAATTATTQTTTTTTPTTPTTMAATTMAESQVSEAMRSLGVSQVLSLVSSLSAGTPIDCQIANGIVMTIAARGYVLWVINVILGICLIHIGAKALRSSPLLTYGKNPIPRIRIPESRNKQSSPNEMVFFGDDSFTPPAPPMQDYNRNRNSTMMPIALNNKNQSIYF